MEFHLQISLNSAVSCVCLQSLSSAVVQVYGADRNSSWVKKCCGVACLVKDNSQRSYFIRVLDMKVSHATHTAVQPFIELGFHLEPNMV